MRKIAVSFAISPDTWEEFKDICEKSKTTVSHELREFVEEKLVEERKRRQDDERTSSL